ncbi:mitochondrial branched-chain alpha-ketoacid dehydrogenase kinase-domain-containing protein [Lipomyces arxii]|uniref:mitochondrial branched-chain alpha-ketoacid dehydrogenase kinase-domain-containing protein n=1 Tax=Lipomyces arxii TaxID=56418 RepID=UPI0034CEA075
MKAGILKSSRRYFSVNIPRLSKYSLHDPNFESTDIDDVIANYAHNETTKTLGFGFDDLIRFGKAPIPANELIENARMIKEIIVTSLSRRASALRNLPYIMMLNPNISQIYHKYLSSLNRVYSSSTELQTFEDNNKFVKALEAMVEEHTDAIPTLAKGFMESQTYISGEAANRFLDTHLHDRIGTRLLSKHHIALSRQSLEAENSESQFIGLVDTQLSPAKLCEEVTWFLSDVSDLQYGIRPVIEFDAGKEITIAYIPEHLEYILTELLKNSFRASIENYLGLTDAMQYRQTAQINTHTGSQPSPVTVTITRTASGLTIRLRDKGGGIAEEHLKRIWGYSESTVEEEVRDGFKTLNTPPPSVTGTGGTSMGGLGYGLPLSRAYAEYFGGSIELETCYSWGTDVYVNIKCPAPKLEV